MKIFTRILLALGPPLLLAACATMGPPQPPSLELPKPPKDLRAVRKGDRVTLSWTIPTLTTDRQTIRSAGQTRICRGRDAELTQCGAPAGEGAAQTSSGPTKPKQKLAASYTDSLAGVIQSESDLAFITYAIEVLNADGRGAGLSNQVRVPLVRTLPPPQDFSARVTSKGVVLRWSEEVAASQPREQYVTRVYRRLENSTRWNLAGEGPVDGELTLIDSNVEWEKTYLYRATILTIATSELHDEVKIEGDDTPEIKVFAHDVFPPAVPSGLQAVFSGPGQSFVDLIWGPVTDLDLDGYNVYRHEVGAAAVKVNADPVKTPAYRDASVVSGKKYFYSVSAIDVRGNESARSEEANETVP
jgi:hypothetical protein